MSLFDRLFHPERYIRIPDGWAVKEYVTPYGVTPIKIEIAPPAPRGPISLYAGTIGIGEHSFFGKLS